MGNVINITEHTYEKMIKQEDKYLPLVQQMVGYYLLMDLRSKEDSFFSRKDIDPLAPELAALSTSEWDFVCETAGDIYYQFDPGSSINELARHWFSLGESAA